MRWHGERKVKKGLIRHPADSEAWQDFEKNFLILHKTFQMCVLDWPQMVSTLLGMLLFLIALGQLS
ncbi:unnamed protein product [Rhodiola kirilowii]